MRWLFNLILRYLKAKFTRAVEAPVLKAEREAEEAVNPARPVNVLPLPKNDHRTQKERDKITFTDTM